MPDSPIPSVLGGLAAGIGLVLVFAVLSNSPFSLQNAKTNAMNIVGGSSSEHFENKLQSDYKEVPNLILVTEDARLFQGEEGTYCIATRISMNVTSGKCVDSIMIFPQTLITRDKGSIVHFRTTGNATLDSVLPWVTNDQIGHPMVLNGTKSSLGSNNNTAFVMDLPKGDYDLNAEVRWTFDNNEGRSYYFYRVHIL